MNKLVLPAELGSLGKAHEFVLSAAAHAGCSAERAADIELAIEELLVNVVTHAYKGAAGEIEISCSQDDHDFIIELQDKGAAFDPLTCPDPDLTKGLAERQIGGLGIYLVKKLTDEVQYERRGAMNWLQVRFHINKGT